MGAPVGDASPIPLLDPLLVISSMEVCKLLLPLRRLLATVSRHLQFSTTLLLTPTTVAGEKRSFASEHLCVCVCV